MVDSVPALFETEDEPSEEEWLYAAAHNPAFNFLADSREDIYSLNDGKPVDPTHAD